MKFPDSPRELATYNVRNLELVCWSAVRHDCGGGRFDVGESSGLNPVSESDPALVLNQIELRPTDGWSGGGRVPRLTGCCVVVCSG